MSSSYKVKKLRKAKRKRIRKIKLPFKLVDPKYRVGFHEVAHAVIIKSFYPQNRVYLSISKRDGIWVGCTAEPDVRGQTRDWHPHALISIAGAIAETYYTQNQLSNSYRVLKEKTEFMDDYQSFGIAFVNYKKTLHNFSEERELSQSELFKKCYFEVLNIFRKNGIVKMHKVAQKLVHDLCIDDEKIWMR